MASFSAFLHVEQDRYELRYSHTGFWQDIDWRGFPRSKVMNSLIVLELVVKTHFFPTLKAWAASSYKTLDGFIEYLRTDADGTDHHWWFKQAYCVGYHFRFDSRGMTGQPSVRIWLVVSPTTQGYERGSGAAFVVPVGKSYEYKPAAALASATPPTPAPSKRRKAGKDGLVAGTPEHQAARWAQYQAQNANNPAAWSQERWDKQYHNNMRNVENGLDTEDQYKERFGGVSKVLKTDFTMRQIDIYREEELYCGQLKTGKIFLGKQEKIDAQKDGWLIATQGFKVEYILEKGASKPMLKALEQIGAKITIGSQL